jgi:hypothetical protein
LVSFVATLVVACGHSDAMIRASDYDQHCTQDRDCTAVFTGDVCTAGCLCENDAVNTLDWPNYEEQLQKLEIRVCDRQRDTCGCFPERAYCANGKCAACPVDQCGADGG